MSLKKIISQIKNHSSFLITSHVNLEGDALGSELALSFLIKSLGKKTMIINEDKLPLEYSFFPGSENIIKYRDNLENIDFDCFVSVDCSDLKRSGEVYRLNTGNKCVLNIDHHISNEKFGTFNWVDPKASSCSEMIYELYKKMGVKITKDAALAMYTGILTDTGSFRYSNTTTTTHRVAAELLKYGIDVVDVYKKAYGNIPYRDMKLAVSFLNKAKRKANGKIMWFEVKAAALKKYKTLYVDLTDYLLNYARAIKETEVAVLFRENLGVKNQVRVNLRSQGKVDVNRIAKFFGGGGHKSAAGCTINATLAQAKKRVINEAAKAVAQI